MGAQWVIGRGLRILAGIEGSDRVEIAREAVVRLTDTSARLELAKAHGTLAEALAGEGSGAEAQREWSAAAELAARCGAAGLARVAAEAADGSGVRTAPHAER